MCKNRKLLLVNASATPKEITKKVLLDAGHSVTHTDSVEKALQLIVINAFDLVVLDIHLPDLMGLDLVSELLGTDIPFIFLDHFNQPIQSEDSESSSSQTIVYNANKKNNLLLAVDSALSWATKYQELKEKEARHIQAIETGRVVDVVVGILMERHHLERERAFEMLRNKARSERKKLRDLAQEILDMLNKINKVSH